MFLLGLYNISSYNTPTKRWNCKRMKKLGWALTMGMTPPPPPLKHILLYLIVLELV